MHCHSCLNTDLILALKSLASGGPWPSPRQLLPLSHSISVSLDSGPQIDSSQRGDSGALFCRLLSTRQSTESNGCTQGTATWEGPSWATWPRVNIHWNGSAVCTAGLAWAPSAMTHPERQLFYHSHWHLSLQNWCCCCCLVPTDYTHSPFILFRELNLAGLRCYWWAVLGCPGRERAWARLRTFWRACYSL